MKAIVIDDFRRRGGGQMYGLTLASTLEMLGYDTSFLTNVDGLERIRDKIAFRVKYEFVENESKIMDFLKIIRLKSELSRIDTKDFSLVVNNHPNVFIKKGDLNILHGFSFLDPWLDENGELTSRIPPLAFRLLRMYKVYEGSLFVPNSRYTRAISRNLFDLLGLQVRLGDVLYPPIVSGKNDALSKKEQAVVFGRISEHKGIDKVVEIAKKSSIKIVVAGFVNRGDEELVARLRREGGRNVEIRTDLSETERERLFVESSTILSLNRKEHFGMAIAEAMGHGCVPVVPKSGGQWIDIVEEGKYGLGYDSMEDVADILMKSFSYGEEQRRRIALSVARFSPTEFRKSLERILEGFASSHT